MAREADADHLVEAAAHCDVVGERTGDRGLGRRDFAQATGFQAADCLPESHQFGRRAGLHSRLPTTAALR
jgi:hypothetical protein